MHTTDPEHLAAELERLAKTLRAEGRAAIARAWDWSGYLRSAQGDGRRGSGSSDPTGTAATQRPPTATVLYAEMSAALKACQVASDALAKILDSCRPSRTDRESGNGLDAVNGRSGVCSVCEGAASGGHVHTGRSGDRLQPIVTGERRDGDLFAPLACDACFRSWLRRPYAEGLHQLIEYDEWYTTRLEWLKTTTTKDVT